MTKIKQIAIKGNRFIDEEGRQVLFHGISLVNKDKHQGYRIQATPDLYARLADWGLNVIRHV
jgi:hypothetical protein